MYKRQGELRVESPGGDCEVLAESPGPGRYVIEGPAGAPFVALYRLEGAARTWVRGTLPAAGAPAASYRLAAVELATVAIAADFPFTVLGPFESDGTNAAELGSLHPGPLNLVLEERDGRRHALFLELEPGDRRQIVLSRG